MDRSKERFKCSVISSGVMDSVSLSPKIGKLVQSVCFYKAKFPVDKA